MRSLFRYPGKGKCRTLDVPTVGVLKKKNKARTGKRFKRNGGVFLKKKRLLGWAGFRNFEKDAYSVSFEAKGVAA